MDAAGIIGDRNKTRDGGCNIEVKRMQTVYSTYYPMSKVQGKNDFQDNLLAAPVYTRPADYKGWKVPDILLSGHEAKIKEWELQQSLERTRKLRPDVLGE